MWDLLNSFFGPLDKSACIYFLIISFLFFVAIMLIAGSELIYVFQNYGKINTRVISAGVIMIFNGFIAYFVNRLLFTMCSKSLA